MSETSIEAFPLCWPESRPRVSFRETARFKTTLHEAYKNVERNARMLGATALVISSNLPLRVNGTPMLRVGDRLTDPAVAVYFTYMTKPMCFSCDRWNRIEDNMQSIARTIEAIRGIERWGTGQMVQQAFSGFLALPNPERPWHVLGLETAYPTREEIDSAYRRRVSDAHQKRDQSELSRLNVARDQLYKNLGY